MDSKLYNNLLFDRLNEPFNDIMLLAELVWQSITKINAPSDPDNHTKLWSNDAAGVLAASSVMPYLFITQ